MDGWGFLFLFLFMFTCADGWMEILESVRLLFILFFFICSFVRSRGISFFFSTFHKIVGSVISVFGLFCLFFGFSIPCRLFFLFPFVGGFILLDFGWGDTFVYLSWGGGKGIFSFLLG